MKALMHVFNRCWPLGLMRGQRGAAAVPASPPPKPQPFLLFLHIPKTAGNSVYDFLDNRFPAGQFHTTALEWSDYPPKFLPGQLTGCLAGHVAFRNVSKYLPANTRVFTVLRDPIERALSAYSYFQSFPRAELAKQSPRMLHIQDLPFQGFIREDPLLAQDLFGNVMTVYLSREHLQIHDWIPRPLDRYDLEVAKRNLSRFIVGLTDHLHDSLLMLSHEYGWIAPDRVTESNKTPKKAKNYPPEVLAWLEEATAFDRQLYKYGCALYQEQWQRYCAREPVAPSTQPLAEEYRLTFDKPIPGYGWYRREYHAGFFFCHSNAQAWLECPPLAGQRLRVEIETLPCLPPEHQSPLELRLNGAPVPVTPIEGAQGRCFQGEMHLAQPTTQPIRLDFHLPRAVRPCDVFPANEDRRVLGIAVKEVRLRAA